MTREALLALADEWERQADAERYDRGQRTRTKAGYEVLEACADALRALVTPPAGEALLALADKLDRQADRIDPDHRHTATPRLMHEGAAALRALATLPAGLGQAWVSKVTQSDAPELAVLGAGTPPAGETRVDHAQGRWLAGVMAADYPTDVPTDAELAAGETPDHALQAMHEAIAQHPELGIAAAGVAPFIRAMTARIAELKAAGETPQGEAQLAEIRAAVEDRTLSDGAARAVVLNVLNPTLPTAADIKWAQGVLRATPDRSEG